MSLEISAETTFLLDMTNAQQFGPELHVDANAASDPNGNEADATTGWTPTGLSGTGANVFESQGAVKSNGSYSLHADANDTPTSGANFAKTFTLLDNGSTYEYSYQRRHMALGNSWFCSVNDGDGSDIVDTITVGESAFVEFKSTFVMVTGTQATFTFQEASGANDGGIYMDNFSLRKVL